MKSLAAIMWSSTGNFEIEEVELDPPKEGEVLVRWEHAGLCHSDEHTRHGDLPVTPPIIGGHEGSGVVEEVGPGVTRVKPGDRFISSWMPQCNQCIYCLRGQHNMCVNGAYMMTSTMLDGTQRAHARGQGMGGVDLLGSFSQWNVIPEAGVVVVDESVPLDVVAILACGVPTGWGSAVNAADTRPGDVVVVFGAGGIGINAVQGAAFAGARMVVAVDPVEFKRDTALKLGATHAFATAEEAQDFVMAETWGHGAQSAIITISVGTTQIVTEAFNIIGKRGTVVLTSVSNPATQLSLPMLDTVLYEKRLVGSLFGTGSPHYTIPQLLKLYQDGHLRLDELITNRYPLEKVNEGYDDLIAGKNIRGVLDIAH
ncbi:NDMA-dependent alcohol dehydrogenase [Gordonia sp. NPDC127522]|uniref:NDMA-dependent alcohol dehydrogenase n=1 Tax=Gordonia sp. NPDC127522 TaxID=3345390 RepID=UPI00363511E7